MTHDELVGRAMIEMIEAVGMENLTPDDNHALNVMARSVICLTLETAAQKFENNGDYYYSTARVAHDIRALGGKE